MATGVGANQPIVDNSYQAEFARTWTERLSQAERAGFDPRKLKPVIQADWRRVRQGSTPYNNTQAALATRSFLGDNPLIKIKDRDSGGGLLGNIVNAVKNVPEDVSEIAAGLNPLTLVPALYHQAESAIENPEQLLKPLGKLAEGNLTGALKQATKTPLLNLIPGVYTAKNVLTGNWNEIVEHPVMTGLDVLPYASAGGKLAMAGKAVEGSAQAAKLAEAGKLRGVVEAQSPAAALLEGKPLKAGFRAVGGTTDSPLSYRWFRAQQEAKAGMANTKPLLYGGLDDAPNGARVTPGPDGIGIIDNPPGPQAFGKQGKGAGAGWVKSVTRRADKAEMPLEVRINATNDAAQNLYGKQGFKVVGQDNGQVVMRRAPVKTKLPTVYRTSDITARIAEKYGFDLETRELNRLHNILRRKEGHAGVEAATDYNSWFEGLSDEDRITVLNGAQRFRPEGLNAEMGAKFTPAMREIIEEARAHVDELAEPYTYDPWAEVEQRAAHRESKSKNEFEAEGAAVRENKRFVAIPNEGGSVDVYPIDGDVGRAYQKVFEKQRALEPLEKNFERQKAAYSEAELVAGETGKPIPEATIRAHDRALNKFNAATKEVEKARTYFDKVHNKAAPARYGELLKDEFRGRLQSEVDKAADVGHTVYRYSDEAIERDIQNPQGAFVATDARDFEAVRNGRPLTEDELRPQQPLEVRVQDNAVGLGEGVLSHYNEADTARVIAERTREGDVEGAIAYAEEHLGIEFTDKERKALVRRGKAAEKELKRTIDEKAAGLDAKTFNYERDVLTDANREAFYNLPNEERPPLFNETLDGVYDRDLYADEFPDPTDQRRGDFRDLTPEDAKKVDVRHMLREQMKHNADEAEARGVVYNAATDKFLPLYKEAQEVADRLNIENVPKKGALEAAKPKAPPKPTNPVTPGEMMDIAGAKLARKYGHDAVYKQVNMGDDANPMWKSHEATVLDEGALRKKQTRPELTPEQAVRAAEEITNNNFGYLVDQGIITTNQLHGIMDDVMSGWQELARRGYDPVYVPHVPASKVGHLLDQKPLAGNLYTPRQFLSKDSLSFAPQAQDMAIAMTSYAKEILKEQSSLEMFKAVKGMAVTQKQLVERYGLEKAERLLSTDYVPYSDTAGRFLSKPQMNLLPDTEKMYIPRVLNSNLDHMMNAFERNPVFGIYDKAMKYYKFGILTGPRHVAHVLFGGLAMMMGEHGVTAFPKFYEALKMVKEDRIPTTLSRGLDYFTPEEWAAMGQGKTMGRMFVKALGSPFKALAKFEEHIANTQRVMTYLREIEKGAKKGLDVAEQEAAAMKLTNKVYMDIDGMAPLERTVLRHVFPFYTFTKHIIRYVLNYPADHPWRASILSSIVRTEQMDHESGLPAHFNDFLFFGAPDENGNQKAIDVKNFNPFRSLDGQNPLTLAGFMSALSPAFTIPASLAGVNTLTATPDLYPTLDYDPRTGKLIARHPDMMQKALGLGFPPSNALQAIFGLSDNWRQLKKSDPDAYNRALMSSMNLPFVPQVRSKGLERGKAEANRYRLAQGALSDAFRSGNTSELERFNLVPFQGSMVKANVMIKLIERLKELYPDVSPGSVVPRSHGEGSLGAALATR